MKVSEVAAQVGIAPTAVRFYERRGLLPRATRRSNGYRDYTEADLGRLRLVVGLRSLGLDLDDAARLAEHCMVGECDVMHRDLGPLVADQRAAIARTQVQLADLDRQLADLETRLAAGAPDPSACMQKGGDLDDELRLRTELPVPADRLTVLTHG